MDVKARLLAVEVLLADPEQLGNDALEGDLYILRDHRTLQGAGSSDSERSAAGSGHRPPAAPPSST